MFFGSENLNLARELPYACSKVTLVTFETLNMTSKGLIYLKMDQSKILGFQNSLNLFCSNMKNWARIANTITFFSGTKDILFLNNLLIS